MGKKAVSKGESQEINWEIYLLKGGNADNILKRLKKKTIEKWIKVLLHRQFTEK